MASTLLFLLAACAPEPATVSDLNDNGPQTRIVEGSAEAFGVMGLLNDAGTTLALLDDDVGLDKRAATALIEHRDGPDGALGTRDDDLYETIAEVDDQYYVGDSALAALLTYAAANGWVPGPDDVVGVWEGVSFTADQVTAVLALVNTASEAELDDDVGLDRRAAAGIVEERPFTGIQQLADVPYVGASALTKLQVYTAPVETEDPGETGETEDLGDVGDDCSTDADCRSDLRCMGAIAYGEGIMCVDTWGVFSWEGPATIPDNGSELVTTVDVAGLASVPVDVVLTVRIDHPRPSDLVLSIDNFNDYGQTLWTDGDDDPALEMVVRAFPSDDAVNGAYHVRVTDTVSGVEGEILGWDLMIVSTYD
ncbi:MAG: helix-hairpin-helix domain-containing protein [Alphaproteobacteria bacterium]|nr:helix-hairpin-helix domain-containing protein [Alphaproteobacteria bacterium]